MEVAHHYLPFALVIPVDEGAEQQSLAQLMPFVGPMRMIDGHATAFVCRDFTCSQPVTSRQELRESLSPNR